MNLIVSDESEFEAKSSEIVESEKIVLQFIKNNWNSQTEYNQLSGMNYNYEACLNLLLLKKSILRNCGLWDVGMEKEGNYIIE